MSLVNSNSSSGSSLENLNKTNEGPYGYTTTFDVDTDNIEEKIVETFKRIDTNNSGRLSRSELYAAFCNPNKKDFTKMTVVLLCGMFDSDESGGLDLKDFAYLYFFMEQWQELWQKYDKRKIGFLSSDDICAALKDLGYSRIDGNLINRIARRLSENESQVNLDGFIRLCCICKRLTDNFRARDKKQLGKVRMTSTEFIKLALKSCF